MTREQKAEIARRNGAKSRGPKTEQGKSVSSRNAVKHGRYAACAVETAAIRAVADHEARERFYTLVRRNLAELSAQTSIERDLAIALADTQWRYERWNLAETKLLNIETREAVNRRENRQSDGLDLDVTIEEAYARALRNLTGRNEFLKRATIERARLMRERGQHLRIFKILRNEFPKPLKRTKEQTTERTNVFDFPAAVSS